MSKIERYVQSPIPTEFLIVDELTTYQEVQNWVWAYVTVVRNGAEIVVGGMSLQVGDKLAKSGDVYVVAPAGMQLTTAVSPEYVIQEKNSA